MSPSAGSCLWNPSSVSVRGAPGSWPWLPQFVGELTGNATTISFSEFSPKVFGKNGLPFFLKVQKPLRVRQAAQTFRFFNSSRLID
jgi:hypothetical protein